MICMCECYNLIVMHYAILMIRCGRKHCENLFTTSFAKSFKNIKKIEMFFFKYLFQCHHLCMLLKNKLPLQLRNHPKIGGVCLLLLLLGLALASCLWRLFPWPPLQHNFLKIINIRWCKHSIVCIPFNNEFHKSKLRGKESYNHELCKI